MKSVFKAALLGGVAVFAVSSAAAAQAPQAAAPAALEQSAQSANAEDSTPSTSQDTAVAEVVVTARRREESLQRVPVAVTAFNEAALNRIQAQSATDLQGAVPNLNIVPGRGSSNAANIYIRGVGQPDALQTFDPAVGVYVDDVYFSRIRGVNLQLLDLQRVEVLRGPQGTLFGKNTIGGAIRFVSRRPTSDWRALAEVSVGTYRDLQGRLALSGPITEGVAFSIAALANDRDGYVHDPRNGREYNDNHTHALRGQLAFTPSENLQIDLSADIQHDDSALNVGQPTSTLSTAFGVVLLPINSNQIPRYDFQTQATTSTPNRTRLTHWGTSANVAWRINDQLSLRSITAYRDLQTDDFIDIDATPLQLGDVFVGVDQNQSSQEFQLNYASGPLNVVGGLFFMRENVSSHQEAYANDFTAPFSFLRTIDDDLTTDSWAAYVNATWEFTDRLRATVGLRYSNDEKDYFRTTTVFSNLAALNTTFAFRASESWSDTSPTFSIDYQATDDILVYGRVARGYKAGGFNGRANTPGEEQPYAPETATSYELGVKSYWLDRRLRANFALFRTDYNDFQARVSRSVTSPAQPIPAIDFAVLNAGELDIQGAELEVAYNPVEGLLLDAQIGLLHAEYGEFFEQRVVGGVVTRVDRSFQRPAFSPRWTARFGAQYEWNLAGAGFVTVGGQARYRSEQALAVDNSDIFTRARYPGMFQGAYTLYDARIVWDSPSRNYSVGVYGQNLGDEVYRTDAQEFSSVGGIRTAYYGAPQTFRLVLTARY